MRSAGLVWYVTYGSNMLSRRLRYYLAGGRPPGGARDYPGCRDRRPPRGSRPARLDGGVYFALESRTWTGGLALYDPHLGDTVAGRAYLVTAGQFSDIAAQEMARPPGTDLDLSEAVDTGRMSVGDGRYETIVRAGPDLDGVSMLTFTAPWRAHQARWNAPAARYLALLARGLREAHGWSVARTHAYLHRLPGVHRPGLRALVRDAYATDWT